MLMAQIIPLFPPSARAPWRPQTRSDCEQGQRPCPFVGCRFNLMVDVTDAGSLAATRLGDDWVAWRARPGKDWFQHYSAGFAESESKTESLLDGLQEVFGEQGVPSCALDVAEEHPDGLTLEEIGGFLGLTRERIRQIESSAIRKLKAAGIDLGVFYAD